jgi:chorismate dehydratase
LDELFPEEGYRYVCGVPARLNSMLARGDIHVCPSSSIAFSAQPEQYLIIPDLSISSCGPVQSVLLFSSTAIEDLDGRTVLLSSESATSVNLLKILLARRYGCSCSFEVTQQTGLSALEPDDAAALLLIGDAALHAAQTASGLYIYDLGEIWYKWTGTPFVFALWLTSRSAVERHGSQLRRLALQLRQAKIHAVNSLELIAGTAAENVWMGREGLLEYWKVLSYDLDERHVEGLKLFFRLAAEAGLIASAPELAFLAPE